MKKRITFNGVEHSAAIENYADEQLKKIVEFLNNERSPIYLDVTFTPSKVRAHHFVELRVYSPNYNLVSSYEGPDFYDTLDRVFDIMYKQLREHKKLLNDKKKTCGRHDEFKKQR